MALEKRAREAVRRWKMEEACTGLAVAVSGGPDSMALLHWYALRRKAFPLYALHVHHGLRPESDEEETTVRNFCADLGVPLTVYHTDVKREKQKGESVESAARRLRYAFFEKEAGDLPFSHLATAHTADDQAETVLLHLLYGAGPQGLGGMAPRRETEAFTLIRPLINCTKSDTIEYCKLHGVPYAWDASNNDVTYTRNRIRAEVLPLLRRINPKTDDALCRAADALREQQAYVDGKAERFLRETGERIPADRLRDLPEGLQSAVLRRLCKLQGKDLSAQQTLRLRELLHKDAGRVEIDRACTACVSGNVFLLLSPRAPLSPCRLREGENELSDGRVLVLSPTTATGKEKNLIRRFLPLTARPRQTGDTLRLTPTGGRATLKKRMIDRKIPRPDRDRLWMVCAGETVLWAEGFGADFDARPAAGEAAWAIEIRNSNEK